MGNCTTNLPSVEPHGVSEKTQEKNNEEIEISVDGSKVSENDDKTKNIQNNENVPELQESNAIEGMRIEIEVETEVFKEVDVILKKNKVKFQNNEDKKLVLDDLSEERKVEKKDIQSPHRKKIRWRPKLKRARSKYFDPMEEEIGETKEITYQDKLKGALQVARYLNIFSKLRSSRKNYPRFSIKTVDYHASRIVKSFRANSKYFNIDNLLKRLVSPFDKDDETSKYRSLYRFISEIYVFDLEKKQEKADNIIQSFKNGIACSEVYSQSFKTLCEKSGLKCKIVKGITKGGSFFHGEHYWNIIYIKYTPYLIDLTWSSGFIEKNNDKFEWVATYNDSFWKPNPISFIYTHFPNKIEDSLLPKGKEWSKNDFVESVKTFKNFVYIADVHPRKRKIEMNGTNILKVKIQTLKDYEMLAKIEPTLDNNDCLIHYDNFTINNKDFESYEAVIAFPMAKDTIEFTLTIYVGKKGENSLDCALEYCVEFKNMKMDVYKFPKLFGEFKNKGYQLISPYEGLLDQKKEYKLSIKPNLSVVGSIRKFVIFIDEYLLSECGETINLEKNEDGCFEARVSYEICKPSFGVAVSYDNTNFSYLVKYYFAKESE